MDPTCAEPALTSLLLEAIKELCAAEAASILLQDHEGNLVFDLVAGGAGAHLSRVRIAPGEGVAGRVLASGLPEICHNSTRSAVSARIEDELGFRTKSLIAVPLLDEEGTPFAVAEAVNPLPGQTPDGRFEHRHLQNLLEIRGPLSDAILALTELGGERSAMPRFYRAVVEVMNVRTDLLRRTNEDLESSRRAFELDRARHYSDEKMRSLARMASGIAHEVNNPLSVALSNLSSLGDVISDLLEGDPLEELLPEMREMSADITGELNRISRIVSRLMLFGDRDVRRVEEVDIAEEVRKVAELIREGALGADAEVNVRADEVPSVHASRSQVRQVVLELVDNAVRAAATTTEERGPWVEIHVFSNQDNVHVSVNDNGPGIPAESQARVFDPFYTTKPSWQATGLGLTAAYGVLRRLGGQITIDSAPTRGTMAVASFPVGEGVLQRSTPSTPDASGRYYEDLR